MQRLWPLVALLLFTACGSGSDGAADDDGSSQSDDGSVKLTVRQPEHGEITVSPAGPYALGATVTLTAVPDASYGFGSWTGIEGTVNPATITLDANTSVSATFIKDAVDVRVSALPVIGGSVTVTPAPPYTKGQQIQVNAEAATGYTFTSWGGVTSTDADLDLTLSDNLTLVANFARTPAALSVNIQPAASAATVSVSPSGQHYVGDTVDVTLTPASGYVFQTWADGNTSASREVVLNGDTTLNVVMIPVPVLTGDAQHIGNEAPYTIAWTYSGAVASYTIEESYNGSAFTLFLTILSASSSGTNAIAVNREPASHCYRVRAAGGGKVSPYSNTHCVQRLPGEKRVKIVNDVASWSPAGKRLNDIVRVHVGVGDSSWSNPNRLAVNDTINAGGDSQSFVTSGSPSTYQVDFAAGTWECQTTGGSCFWHAEQTQVIGCDQKTIVYKLQGVTITGHTYDTITIHTKDWFPVGNYGQCLNGHCAVDPVCY